MLALLAASLRQVESITSGAVSLSPPFLPLVRGVLTAEQMTTSSSDLAAVFSLRRVVARLLSLCIRYHYYAIPGLRGVNR